MSSRKPTSYSQEIASNALPIDIKSFNRMKKFIWFLTYGLRHELIAKYPKNEYANWLDTLIQDNTSETFFKKFLPEIYKIENSESRHPLSLYTQVSGMKHLEELFGCGVNAVYICACPGTREKYSTLWSVIFSENDAHFPKASVDTIINAGWSRATKHSCSKCGSEFRLTWEVKKLSRFLVIDFERGAPKNRINIGAGFLFGGQKYVLKAIGAGQYINVRLEGTKIEENLFGEYYDLGVNIPERVLSAEDLKSENIDLLIFERL